MKRYILIAIAILTFTNAIAQDWSAQQNTGNNGKKYNSYLTNNWNDNLYFGVAGGISTRFTAGKKSDIEKCFINPNIDVYILKWFTPCVGARFGYRGINGREGLKGYFPYQINHAPFAYWDYSEERWTNSSPNSGVLHYGSFNVHGDILWNITNTYAKGGFKKDRFYTISAYLSWGYLRLYDNKTGVTGSKGWKTNYDQEWELGIGLFNTFQITDRLIATADLRFSNHASRYRTSNGARTNVPSLTVGVAYNIFKTTWNDVKEVNATVNEALASAKAAEAIMEETQQKNDKLNKEIDKLNNELAELKNDESIKVDPVTYADLKARAEKADLIVYFYINKSTLNFSELYHLDTYVRERLAKDPDAKFKVTGSADKGTGNETINARLSLERALRVKAILIKDYGVKAENITIDNIITDKHVDGALDRCAMFER